MCEGEGIAALLLSEEEVVYPDELVLEVPAFEVIGDLYVCSNCGCPLTEIPAYNRFYCENCDLHY